MSDERDKALVRQSITEALSFLRADRNLAEKIISGQIRAKKTLKKGLRRAAALCAAAALVCVIIWNWPAPVDLLAKENNAAHLPGSTEEAAFSPREWREWCPKCDEVTLWLECCLADGYTKEYNQQSELLYHQANGQSCGYYEVSALTCRFCTKCGNVYILSDRHLHAVVHLNCGEGEACPCAAYWEKHQSEYPAYRRALEWYNHP